MANYNYNKQPIIRTHTTANIL